MSKSVTLLPIPLGAYGPAHRYVESLAAAVCAACDFQGAPDALVSVLNAAVESELRNRFAEFTPTYEDEVNATVERVTVFVVDYMTAYPENPRSFGKAIVNVNMLLSDYTV